MNLGNNQNVNDEVKLRRPKDFLEPCDRLKNMGQVDGTAKTLGWLQDRYSFAGLTMSRNDLIQEASNRLSCNGPISQNNNGNLMGWTRSEFNVNNDRRNQNFSKRIGFVRDDDYANKNNDNNLIGNNGDPFKELYDLYAQRQNQIRNLNENGEPYMTSNGRIIMAQSAMIDRYMRENFPKRDNDSDDEYMDTTATLNPPRKNSQSSSGTKTGKDGVLHSCSIS